MSATKRARSTPLIGTHNGTFHCDEALAVFLLRKTTTYRGSDLVRTRTPAILDTCDIVVDVGGTYNAERQRFDHHQRGFEEVFGHGFNIKLSSAGLVYKHFGKEIISNHLEAAQEDPKIETLWLKLYKEFIASIDAIDNGISQYPSSLTGETKATYNVSTDLSSRVGHLNPAWNETLNDSEVDSRFGNASTLTGTEFLSRLDYYAKAWLPARDLLIDSIKKSLTEVDTDGRIIVLDQYLPWKEHLHDIESAPPPSLPLKAGSPTYVLYSDGSSWRVQAVSITPGSFESRKPLPAAWCGLRDDALSKESGIEGGVFVHASGFIGGNSTKEGALQMAKKALVL